MPLSTLFTEYWQSHSFQFAHSLFSHIWVDWKINPKKKS